MVSKNNITHITNNHITATIILIISKRNENKSHSNDIGLLTTMNSKVKVHVVDGSKCAPDGRHDKEEPRPRRSFIFCCCEALSRF